MDSDLNCFYEYAVDMMASLVKEKIISKKDFIHLVSIMPTKQIYEKTTGELANLIKTGYVNSWKECEDKIIPSLKVAIYYFVSEFYASSNQYNIVIILDQRSIAIVRKIGDKHTEASLLHNLGLAYVLLNQYDESIQYLASSLMISEKINNDSLKKKTVEILLNAEQFYLKELATYTYYKNKNKTKDYNSKITSILRYLSEIYHRLKYNEKEINCLAKLLNIVKNYNNNKLISAFDIEFYLSLAYIYTSKRQYHIAIAYYQKSLYFSLKSGDRHATGIAFHNLGHIHQLLGQNFKAIKGFSQSIKIKREIKDKQGEALSLYCLAYVYLLIGETKKAIEYNKYSLSIAQETKDKQSIAHSLCNLGLTYKYQGQDEKAFEYLNQSLILSTKIGDKQCQAACLCNLAGLAEVNTVQELENYKQALAICREIRDRRGEAIILHNLAGNKYFLITDIKSDLTNVFKALQESLAIRREIKDRNGEAHTLQSLGGRYYSIFQYDKAIEYLKQSLKVSQEIQNKNVEVSSLNIISKIYIDLLKIPKAIETLQKGLKIAHPLYMPKDLIEMADNLGQIMFDQKKWGSAIEAYSSAIKVIEQMIGEAATDLRRQQIIGSRIETYWDIVICFVNLEQYDKALEYVERSRSKHLVDLMESTKLFGGEECLSELEQLSKDYDLIQQRINAIRFHRQPDNNQQFLGTGTIGINQSINCELDIKKIEKLETEKQEKWRQIRKLDPVLAGQKQVEPLNIAQIQALITNSSTAILSFYTIHNDTYIFILRQDKETQLYTCNGQGEDFQEWLLDNWINPYIHEKAKWREDMEKNLQEISQRLRLNDLVSKYLTDIEELIIVPHFCLHFIPFTALPISNCSLPSVANSEVKNSEEDERFSFICSLSFSSRAFGATPKKTEYTSSATKSSSTASSHQYLGQRFRLRILPSLQILNHCQQRPSIKNKFTGIVEDATSDLYFTSFECENIAKIDSVVPDNRLKQQTATTNNYYQLVKNQNINKLHSSHHAAFHPNKPLESTLLLADGSLTLGQLISPGWRMPQLNEVFLSCCETNLTKPKLTDNILTIATGFLCAGARSVVSTQWAVDDLATALFSIFYYEERHECSSRSQALQKAQQRLRTLTGKELATKYKFQIEEILKEKLDSSTTIDDKALIQNAIIYLKIKCREYLPFVHPVYWAGFISQGS